MRDSSANLLEKYGTVQDVNSTASKPKYTQRVLFGATKECSNEPNEPACSLVPESPLPKDIYGEETDKHIEGKYNRPSYMSSSMVIGHVSDLRPIYKEATELLQVHNKKHSSQNIFSKMFGEQEAARQIYAASQSQKKSSHWSPWLPSRQSQTSLIPNITLAQDKNYEFGIDLDYRSSLFQVMNNSVKDIRFITFNHPSIIASSAKLSASTFAKPISLPPDLMIAPPPYSQHTVSSSNPNPPITALDTISDSNQATWNDLSLATNVIVPGSSVPASLNFHGSEDLLSQLWESMWFHKNSRALMRRYIRSPDGPIAAKAAAGGGDKWWDLRGGKGGVWTDKGEWLEWNEVCGTFDEEVFGDGMGGFGREDVEVGGQKVVYNAFGQVVEGKVKKPASKENKEVGK
jgi:hypothetical protein